MPMNIDKYRKHLAPLKLGKNQEEDIIRFIIAVMDEFVSAAFGKHPVQQAVDEKNRKSLQSQSDMVDSKDRNTTQDTFQYAATRRDR